MFQRAPRFPARMAATILCLLVLLAGLPGCAEESPSPVDNGARLASIPAGAVKVTPGTDPFPPVMHLPGWKQPVPLPCLVNTAGTEDSPFITPEGSEFYFFFTPDMHIPAVQQAADGVTGIE